MNKKVCLTAWGSLTFGNRIINKYGVRRRGLNLPVLVLLKQFRNGSGQGIPAKNAAGHTIRLSLNLWYHYYGNKMGNGMSGTEALLPASRLTPVTVGISRPAAQTLTYGSSENVRVEKTVQAYGMRNAFAGAPPFSHGIGARSQNSAFVSTSRVFGVIPDQVWNKTPLLDLSSESAGPSSFFQRQLGRIIMLSSPASFHAFRKGTRHAATIINDKLPGAVPGMVREIHSPFLKSPGVRVSEKGIEGRITARDEADYSTDIPNSTILKPTGSYGIRSVFIGSRSSAHVGGETRFSSPLMTASQQSGALPGQVWGRNPLPGLTPGAVRLLPRSHRQLERFAMPLKQASPRLSRKGGSQSPITTNDSVPDTVTGMAGQVPAGFLKNQDVHVPRMGTNERMTTLDAALHSMEAENTPRLERTGNSERVKRSAHETVFHSTGRLRHPVQSGMLHGRLPLPSVRLIPVIVGISGSTADGWTDATSENGEIDAAAQAYGRRNTLAGGAFFTHEGADLFQSKLPPASLQASISSSGKTWDVNSPLVHKRSGHISGASEKTDSSSTTGTNNNNASYRPDLVMDETVISGAHRVGAGSSETFPDTKGLAASGQQTAIPAAELKRVADSVYKMVEKRIMIERERRGM